MRIINPIHMTSGVTFSMVLSLLGWGVMLIAAALIEAAMGWIN